MELLKRLIFEMIYINSEFGSVRKKGDYYVYLEYQL